MSQLPRKGKPISGVDSSSLLGLNAALFRAQQEKRQGLPRAPPAVPSAGRGRDLFAARNRGVDERDERARESEERAQERTGSSLMRKSELYAEVMRGAAASDALGAAAGESLVDWDRKQYARATLVSSDMQRDAERRIWERNATAEINASSATVQHNSSVKRYLSEVVQEENDDRERAAAQRSKREQDRAARSGLIAAKRAALRGARVLPPTMAPDPDGSSL